jgi:hypothetical protein
VLLKIAEERTFINGIYINDSTKKYNFIILEENVYLPKNDKYTDYLLISVIYSDNYLNIIENINNLKKQNIYNDIFIKKYINTILNSELITKNTKNKISLYFNL